MFSCEFGKVLRTPLVAASLNTPLNAVYIIQVTQVAVCGPAVSWMQFLINIGIEFFVLALN